MMLKKLLCVFAAYVLICAFSAGAFSARAEAAEKDTASSSAVDRSKCLNFDNSETKWEGPIQFYVYDPSDDSATGKQTYDLVFDPSCFGDITDHFCCDDGGCFRLSTLQKA